VDYTLGLTMNAVLKRRSEEILAEEVRNYEETGQPQRLFTAFDYQAASWPQPRWTIVKAESHAQGTNRRAVVTNRPGARVLPQTTYDEYTERGESENHNKELKCGLQADRLSDHRYMANLFRLYLHALAANLLAQLRSVVADPPPPAMVTFERGDESLRYFYDLAQSERIRGKLKDEAGRKPFFKSINSTLEANPLPPFEVLRQYLAPGGAIITDDETGIHYMDFTLKRRPGG
jgi:hypothetical protein